MGLDRLLHFSYVPLLVQSIRSHKRQRVEHIKNVTIYQVPQKARNFMGPDRLLHFSYVPLFVYLQFHMYFHGVILS
jgi:hypothetical protein